MFLLYIGAIDDVLILYVIVILIHFRASFVSKAIVILESVDDGHDLEELMAIEEFVDGCAVEIWVVQNEKHRFSDVLR